MATLNRRINLYINGNEAENSIKSVQAELRKLTAIQAKATIGSKEYHQAGARIRNLKGIIADHNKQLKTTGSTLGSLKTQWLAVAAAIAGTFAGLRGLLQLWDGRRKANDQLLHSLKGQEAVQQRLIRQASELQSLTGHDDDAIKQQMVFLAMQGRTEEQISKTIRAAIELAAVTGTGLPDAVKRLDQSMEGQLGRLGNLDSGFKELTTEQLRNGAAVDLVLEKYSGLAQKGFEAGLASLTRLTNGLGDLGKTIGGFVAVVLLPVFNILSRAVDQINANLDEMGRTAHERFNAQISVMADLEGTIRPLAARYTDLSEKANLNATEQKELERITRSLASAIPGSITAFDEYGNAVSISTTRIEEHIAQQKNLLRYTNSAAIRETEKDLRKAETQLEDLQHKINQIAERGTFSELFREVNTLTNQVTTGFKDATDETVSATVSAYQDLLNRRQGIQARLDELTGDSIEKEIARRKAEAAALRAAGGGIVELGTAYEVLTKEIAAAKKEIQDFTAAGDFDQAKGANATLKNLEAQMLVLNGIIAKGGDVLAYLAELTDAEAGLLQETLDFNEKFVTDFGDIFAQIATDREAARQEELERDTRRREHELTLEQEAADEKARIEKDLADKKIEYEKQASAAKQQITDAGIYHAFRLADQYINANFQNQVTALNKQRNAELENANLTSEERQRINEKYEKKQAELKTVAFKRQRNADLILSAITGFLAVQRALAAPPGWPLNSPGVITAGIMAALQTAAIAAAPVPQYSQGRYHVTGATDGKKYRVPFIGKAKTGMVRSPALVAETGMEMIIDPSTLKQLDPAVIEHIQRARMGVRQYSDGRYPATNITPANGERESLTAIIKQAAAVMSALQAEISDLKKTELKARVNYQELQQMDEKVNTIENKTKI